MGVGGWDSGDGMSRIVGEGCYTETELTALASIERSTRRRQPRGSLRPLVKETVDTRSGQPRLPGLFRRSIAAELSATSAVEAGNGHGGTARRPRGRPAAVVVLDHLEGLDLGGLAMIEEAGPPPPPIVTKGRGWSSKR